MRRRALLLLLTALPTLEAAAARPKSAVPADFRLVAQYGSGESDWKSWKTTVGADGRATQEVYDADPHTVKHFSVRAADLRRLEEALRQARFFDLAGEYSGGVTDAPTLVLQITAGGRARSVRVYAPDDVKEQEGVRRFLQVWREALRAVPAPNREQLPELYR